MLLEPQGTTPGRTGLSGGASLSASRNARNGNTSSDSPGPGPGAARGPVVLLPALPGNLNTQKVQLAAAKVVLEQLLYLRGYLPLPVHFLREYLKAGRAAVQAPDSPEDDTSTEPNEIALRHDEKIAILDEMGACDGEDEHSMQVDSCDEPTAAVELHAGSRAPIDTAVLQSRAMARQVGELGGSCLQKCTRAVLDVDEAFEALNFQPHEDAGREVETVFFVFGATLYNPAEVYEVPLARSAKKLELVFEGDG